MKPTAGCVTREMPQLSLRASIRPGSLDAEKRTVDLIWTTGARVLRGFWEQYYEELSLDPKHVRMGRLNGGAPLLNAHNSYDLGDVLGVVESARLEKDQGVATVRFARAEDDPDADAVFRKVKDGVIRNVSVGYRVHRLEKVEDGEGKVPVMRATDWEPYEISMVPMGADAGAGVRSEGAVTNPCEFILVQERTMAKTKPTRTAAVPTVRAEEGGDKEDEEGETPAEVPAPAPEGEAEGGTAEEKKDGDGEESGRAIIDLAVRKDRKRASDIRRIGRSLSIDDKIIERHIELGTGVDKFRSEAQTMYEQDKIETGSGPRIEAGADARDKYLRGAGDALLIQSGAATTVIEAARKRGETVKVDPGEFRGMSLIDLARAGLERVGVRTIGMGKDEVIRRVLARSGGAMATGDFPILLESYIHKQLLANYEVTPDTWTRFCAIGSLSDFRAHKRYRMGSISSLDTVLEGGEYATKTLADAESASITAVKRGNIVRITREMMINDDLDAMSKLPAALGRAAKRSEEVAVYALLALNSGDGPTMGDSVALFHTSSHGANKTTSAAISVAAIDLDRQAMAAQRDPSNNEYLDLRPAILLCGMAVGGTARVINDAQYDPDTANKLQRPNMVRGLFKDVVDTPRITGNRRYLFADPAVAPTIEVAFLGGQREPTLVSEEAFTSDSMAWKVRHEFGVAAVDYRGAVTNAGG